MLVETIDSPAVEKHFWLFFFVNNTLKNALCVVVDRCDSEE